MNSDDVEGELSALVQQLLERARRRSEMMADPIAARAITQKLEVLNEIDDLYAERMATVGRAVRQASLAVGGQLGANESAVVDALQREPQLLLTVLGRQLKALGVQAYLEVDFGDDWGAVELPL